jgi:hypothetical protein
MPERYQALMAAREAAYPLPDRRRDPAWVAPLVAVLASPQCPVSGGTFSAAGGRFARAFTALGPGWISEDGPPEPSELLQHWDEVEERSGFKEPASVFEEMEAAGAALARAGIV